MPRVALSRSQREIVQRVVKRQPSFVEQTSSSSLEPVISAPENPFCRICYDTELVDNPLIAPCSCKGSLENVHLRCLLDWREHIRDTGQMGRYYRCEICRKSYNIPEELLPLGPANINWWINKTHNCWHSLGDFGHKVLNSDIWGAFVKAWRIGVLAYASICGVKQGLLWSKSILKRTALHWDTASQLLNRQVPALTLLAILYPNIQSHLAVAFLALQASLGLYVISSLVIGALAGLLYGCLAGTLTASTCSLNLLVKFAGMGAQAGCKLVKIPLLISFRGIRFVGRVMTAPVKLFLESFAPADLKRGAGIQLYRCGRGYNKFNNLQ